MRVPFLSAGRKRESRSLYAQHSRSLARSRQRQQARPPVHIELHNVVEVVRGLGSSALAEQGPSPENGGDMTPHSRGHSQLDFTVAYEPVPRAPTGEDEHIKLVEIRLRCASEQEREGWFLSFEGAQLVQMAARKHAAALESEIETASAEQASGAEVVEPAVSEMGELQAELERHRGMGTASREEQSSNAEEVETGGDLQAELQRLRAAADPRAATNALAQWNAAEPQPTAEEGLPPEPTESAPVQRQPKERDAFGRPVFPRSSEGEYRPPHMLNPERGEVMWLKPASAYEENEISRILSTGSEMMAVCFCRAFDLGQPYTAPLDERRRAVGLSWSGAGPAMATVMGTAPAASLIDAVGREGKSASLGKRSLQSARRVVLKVEGMTSEHCVARVRAALKSVQGVETVDVQLAEDKHLHMCGSTVTGRAFDAGRPFQQASVYVGRQRRVRQSVPGGGSARLAGDDRVSAARRAAGGLDLHLDSDEEMPSPDEIVKKLMADPFKVEQLQSFVVNHLEQIVLSIAMPPIEGETERGETYCITGLRPRKFAIPMEQLEIGAKDNRRGCQVIMEGLEMATEEFQFEMTKGRLKTDGSATAGFEDLGVSLSFDVAVDEESGLPCIDGQPHVRLAVGPLELNITESKHKKILNAVISKCEAPVRQKIEGIINEQINEHLGPLQEGLEMELRKHTREEAVGLATDARSRGSLWATDASAADRVPQAVRQGTPLGKLLPV